MVFDNSVFFIHGGSRTRDRITVSSSNTSIGRLSWIGDKHYRDTTLDKLAEHALLITFSFTDEQPTTRYFTSNPFVDESIMEVDGEMASAIQNGDLYQGKELYPLEIVVKSLNHFKLRTYGSTTHDIFLSLDYPQYT